MKIKGGQPMENLKIKKLNDQDTIPYDLLLLADPSMETIQDYIHRGSIYIASIGHVMVGIYVLIRTRPLTLELVNIAVREEYQGKGIGRSLVQSAMDMARKEKAKVLEVGTGNSSIGQLALYQKCGFRIIGIDRDFFKKHYKEKIIENGIECMDMIRLAVDL